ncbi:MAG: RnfABCDGE type electron transport complex subunit G [Bacteroidales bacterium]|nr:RnfABCDGE type electron transport complex subunit G [Bacteroidales bacterium]
MAAKSNLTNMVLVLGLVCLLCSAVLGGAYVITKAPIEAAAAAKTQQAVAQVLPHFETLEYNDDANYYTAKDGEAVVGYAIESSVVGFGGPLSLMVGVTADGVVYNTSVLSHSETPGLGAKCSTDAKFIDQWRGFDPSVKKISVKKDGGDVDAITASTITSRAYTLAVENALNVFSTLDPSSPAAPQDDSTVILSDSEESTNEVKEDNDNE